MTEKQTSAGQRMAELNIRLAAIKDLCGRAADALEHESWVSEEQCGLPSQFAALIAELRKAAE